MGRNPGQQDFFLKCGCTSGFFLQFSFPTTFWKSTLQNSILYVTFWPKNCLFSYCKNIFLVLKNFHFNSDSYGFLLTLSVFPVPLRAITGVIRRAYILNLVTTLGNPASQSCTNHPEQHHGNNGHLQSAAHAWKYAMPEIIFWSI